MAHSYSDEGRLAEFMETAISAELRAATASELLKMVRGNSMLDTGVYLFNL